MLRELSNDLLRSETAACVVSCQEPRAATHRAEVVASLAHERVDEVGAAEGASDEGEDGAALGGADLRVPSDMGEDVLVA